MGQAIDLTEVKNWQESNQEEAGTMEGSGGAIGMKGNVIICPGGAYQWLSPRESLPVAEAFAARGWKPWILRYKVSDHGAPLGTTPLCQAAGAVARVRDASPGKPVVLCGFSAGGHVAASLGVHWNDGSLFPKEYQAVIRPDGLILGYPVITAGQYAHRVSIEMLAGSNPGADAYFGLEAYVDAQTPPVFLWHTAGDRSVPVQNSLCFAGRLAEMGVPFEMHIYPYGEHGLSLATKEVEDPENQRYEDSHVAGWFEQCAQWLDMVFVTV